MPDKIGLKVTNKEFEKEVGPMELDLIAVFKTIEEEMLDLVNESEKEGWTPEELIKRMEKVL